MIPRYQSFPYVTDIQYNWGGSSQEATSVESNLSLCSNACIDRKNYHDGGSSMAFKLKS